MRLGPLGLLAALALATAGAGCGKTETARHSAGQTAETIPAVSEQGAVGLATSNTTRLGAPTRSATPRRWRARCTPA